MKNLRWGILSTANIGIIKVIPAIQRAARCEVVAISPRPKTIPGMTPPMKSEPTETSASQP